ncbi:DUF2971 domain-containing protein [Pollutimonas sp. M17]|uniref:DUF2971 domain-containing protein n=1 Tax=Pollutimonas sp. M17 TaxID=2962065 RepID=UPI0021F40E11|nr:DUF2971 domain-containing protein [Pollutimonas sp. M17]UYO92424.1 DUF2971 domain-containing protein [Pollutimonas sp. M17]
MVTNKKDYLYRIVKFHHAVDILRGELHFSHPSLWEDPYEVRVKHEYENAIFAQCWCKKSLSDAMWRIYSPDQLGVRIRTTREKLTEVMLNFIQHQKDSGEKYKYRLQVVKYKSTLGLHRFTKKIVGHNDELFSPSKAADILCVKRNAFEHEAEVRAFLYRATKLEEKSEPFLKVPVDGHYLIDSILIDPRAPNDLYLALKKYLEESMRYNGVIAQSELYRTPPIQIVESLEL